MCITLRLFCISNKWEDLALSSNIRTIFVALILPEIKRWTTFWQFFKTPVSTGCPAKHIPLLLFEFFCYLVVYNFDLWHFWTALSVQIWKISTFYYLVKSGLSYCQLTTSKSFKKLTFCVYCWIKHNRSHEHLWALMSPKEHSRHEYSCEWFFGGISAPERLLHNGAMVMLMNVQLLGVLIVHGSTLMSNPGWS